MWQPQLACRRICRVRGASFRQSATRVVLCRMQALLHSSHLYHEAKVNMAKYGVMADNVQIDVAKMMARQHRHAAHVHATALGTVNLFLSTSRLPSEAQEQKSKAVSGLTKGIEGLFKKNKASQTLTAPHRRTQRFYLSTAMPRRFRPCTLHDSDNQSTALTARFVLYPLFVTDFAGTVRGPLSSSSSHR